MYNITYIDQVFTSESENSTATCRTVRNARSLLLSQFEMQGERAKILLIFLFHPVSIIPIARGIIVKDHEITRGPMRPLQC